MHQPTPPDIVFFQAREADERARTLEEEFKAKESHLKQREEQLKSAFTTMRSEMDARLAAAAERQKQDGAAQMRKIKESEAQLREKERALEEKLAAQEASMMAEMQAKMDAEMNARAEQMEREFAEKMKLKEMELKKREEDIQRLQSEVQVPSTPQSKAQAKEAEMELAERERHLQELEGGSNAADKSKRKKRGPKVFFPEDEDEENVDDMDDAAVDAALAREKEKVAEETLQHERQLAELEAGMQAKLAAALKEAEDMRALQQVEHEKASKLAEQIAAKKIADLEAREKALKEREEKILMERRKHEEKGKMLSEKEKLMEILQRGREGKMKADYDQKFHELSEKEAALQQQAADAAAMDKLMQVAGAEETPAVADEPAAGGGDHQYSKAEMETYLRSFFEGYDYDYSGYITSADFHAALLSFPDGPSDAVATQLVKSIEEDGYCCYEKFVQNYISEIGLKDEPYDEATYDDWQQAQQLDEAWTGEQYHQHDEQHQQHQGGGDGWGEQYHSGSDAHGWDHQQQARETVPCSYCVDGEGTPAVHAAATNGHVECLEAYLTGRARSAAGEEPLQLVGALDASARTALFCACAANQFNCVAVMLQTCDEAVESGGASGVKAVQDVLNAQDKRGDTAVHAATVNGFHECLEMLLQSGAESDVPNHKGQEPVHLSHGENCLEVLVDFAADVYAQDSMGRTTVFMAAANGEEGVLRGLLDMDEDQLMIDLGDDRGDTPLHAAACNGRHSCLKLLLETMADPGIGNAQGLLPGYLAECNGHVRCVELLEKYGGYKRQTDLTEAKAREDAKHAEREKKKLEKKERALAATQEDFSKWAEASDESGAVYYWNVDTGESRWEAPEGYEAYKQQQVAAGAGATSPVQRVQSQEFGDYGSPYSNAAGSPQQYGRNQAAYGSEYWGAAAQEQYWGEGSTGYDEWGNQVAYQNTYEEATEGYDYTADWEEYWQWYGYEEQEEAPRLEFGDEAADAEHWAGGEDAEANEYAQYHDEKAAAVAANSAAAAKAIAEGPKLNKNYLKMSQNYAAQAPYRLPKTIEGLGGGDSAGNKEAEEGAQGAPYCMLCQERVATSVLLPCEHRSVCDACIREHSYGITTRRASAATGGALLKVKPQQCPACSRRCYKVVPIDKFFKLPRDYGPAPKINTAFAMNFSSAAEALKSGKVPNASAKGGGGGGGGGGKATAVGGNGKPLKNIKTPGGAAGKVERETKSEQSPLLEVEFGPGSIGLELVPKPGSTDGGAVVKNVSGVAEAKRILPKMRLMLVNGTDVSKLIFKDLMQLLSKSGRPIKMTFQGDRQGS